MTICFGNFPLAFTFLHMDGLTLFGLVAVMSMLVFYSLESRSASFTLAFAFLVGWGRLTDFCKAPGRLD